MNSKLWFLTDKPKFWENWSKRKTSIWGKGNSQGHSKWSKTIHGKNFMVKPSKYSSWKGFSLLKFGEWEEGWHGYILPQARPVHQPNQGKRRAEVTEELSHAWLELLWYSVGSYFLPRREGPAPARSSLSSRHGLCSDMRGVGSIRAGRQQVWRDKTRQWRLMTGLCSW